MCCFFNLTIQDLLYKKWPEYNQDFTDYFQNETTKYCHLPDENRTRVHYDYFEKMLLIAQHVK